MKPSYVIIFVSDMERSVRFYRDVLGLPLRFQSAGWSEFQNEGTPIALHETSAGEPPPHKTVGTSQLGFRVDDLEGIHTRFESHGVRCMAPPDDAPYGVRQAIYADPDGYCFTVAQLRSAQARGGSQAAG